ncbi:MAG: hypothetical protein PHS73_04095 [Candidatus Peribacteraceae bacterium]|nr:hypothetical protein [Candidatus Peribacteraceae bacterium]
MKSSFSFLTASLLLALAPVCAAQGTPLPQTDSGTVIMDTWEIRAARAAGFRNQRTAFALQRSAAWSKWQLSRRKLTDRLDRCHTEIRASNRDTLLPVTQQCLKGQLIIERDALKRDRTVYEKLPGLSDAVRATLLVQTDALTGALQTIIDGMDAHVFSTMAQLKDVRANLLKEYRQPYWFALTRSRADELLTWTAHLLTALSYSAADSSIPPAAHAKAAEASACLEGAETAFATVLTDEDAVSARTKLTAGMITARTCNALITEAWEVQKMVQETQD